jgi:hypothetical protein
LWPPLNSVIRKHFQGKPPSDVSITIIAGHYRRIRGTSGGTCFKSEGSKVGHSLADLTTVKLPGME